MKTILFQGDSITDAGRSREFFWNPGVGYSTLIRGELGLAYPGQYCVLNRGISGNRIVDLYARIKADMINLKPDILSVLIGVNDVWHEIEYKNGVDAEKFYKIYSMLIEEIKEALPNTKLILLEPFVLKGNGTEEHWETFYTEVRKRAQKTEEAAQKYGLSFVALQEMFEDAAKRMPNEYWLMDGVHPTTAGHGLIKRAWMKTFLNLEHGEEAKGKENW